MNAGPKFGHEPRVFHHLSTRHIKWCESNGGTPSKNMTKTRKYLRMARVRKNRRQ